MAKLKHVDPNTFVETELEIDDMHLGIAELLNDATKGVFNVTQIFSVDTSGNRLIFGISGDREPGEPPAQKFRVTIEKINNENNNAE